MESIVNKRGVKIEIGKWYKVYNLNSGRATETWQVTGFLFNSNGFCYGVNLQGKQWYETTSRWLDFIWEELL